MKTLQLWLEARIKLETQQDFNQQVYDAANAPATPIAGMQNPGVTDVAKKILSNPYGKNIALAISKMAAADPSFQRALANTPQTPVAPPAPVPSAPAGIQR